VFTARPPAGPLAVRDLELTRAVRRTFTGPAEFLADPASRARVGEYLTDMARPYGRTVPAGLFTGPVTAGLGQSYGEMADELITAAVSPDEPVDLLMLAFAVHDFRPGRQTAAYLSSRTPGAPAAFALCDQGSAAAFTGLRIAQAYAASAAVQRVLLIVVEQAVLPYDCPVPLPSQHRGVALLLRDGTGLEGAGLEGAGLESPARITGLRQHAGVQPAAVAGLADADLAALAAGHSRVTLVLSDALAGRWTAPAAGRVRVMPPGQPATAAWWGLIDELSAAGDGPGLVVTADYDPGLRYLCLTAVRPGGSG
jgi:hypothetical protein